jgi:hypothetical protein
MISIPPTRTALFKMERGKFVFLVGVRVCNPSPSGTAAFHHSICTIMYSHEVMTFEILYHNEDAVHIQRGLGSSVEYTHPPLPDASTCRCTDLPVTCDWAMSSSMSQMWSRLERAAMRRRVMCVGAEWMADVPADEMHETPRQRG